MVQKEKTRNGQQWTEGRYRSFITSALRSASRRWPPKYGCIRDAFVKKKKNPKTGRIAAFYKCMGCGDTFTQKDIQVDHIEPIGKDLSWDEFIEKLFCEKENLQVLCKKCHKEKTKSENKKGN